MMQTRLLRLGAALAACVPMSAWAQSADPHRWQLNMGKGVTPMAHNAYNTHMWGLWMCVVIGVIVFGAMFYALFAFRKSKGAVAAKFSHNTKAEIIWTVIPILILVVLTIPTIRNLIYVYDTGESALTVRITGYQWMWKYDYLAENIDVTSRLSKQSNDIRQSGKDARSFNDSTYLLDVDHPLVLPVNTKIRFVVTADDVIHSWWVPAFGLKQDAIPGIVNEAWVNIEQPGIYRGQCAELCGKDHGFMPIVVKAVTMEEYKAWVAEQKAAKAAATTPPATAPAAAD
ncbi:cytochrome c oxidase subunit II [Solilutibacter silvestris]|uniref:cytochrome c oxidase subunit II n=1 Tax=Solilutibacter silvestris TaxID=1645665 RepID=UPI003D35248B